MGRTRSRRAVVGTSHLSSMTANHTNQTTSNGKHLALPLGCQAGHRRAHGTHLRDVDQQAGVGDVGHTDQPLLDDSLPLNLDAGDRGARRQQQRRWPRAGVLSDVVDLLGRDRNGLMQPCQE